MGPDSGKRAFPLFVANVKFCEAQSVCVCAVPDRRLQNLTFERRFSSSQEVWEKGVSILAQLRLNSCRRVCSSWTLTPTWKT